MPRSVAGAVIHDPALVAARAARMAVQGLVTTADGTDIATPVRSICVHGDTPGAVELARRVRAGLSDAGLEVTPFA